MHRRGAAARALNVMVRYKLNRLGPGQSQAWADCLKMFERTLNIIALDNWSRFRDNHGRVAGRGIEFGNSKFVPSWQAGRNLLRAHGDFSLACRRNPAHAKISPIKFASHDPVSYVLCTVVEWNKTALKHRAVAFTSALNDCQYTLTELCCVEKVRLRCSSLLSLTS